MSSPLQLTKLRAAPERRAEGRPVLSLDMTPILLLLLVGATTPEPTKGLVSKSACGFELAVPHRWSARTIKAKADTECEIHLIPPGWRRLRETLAAERDVPEFAIRLRTTGGGVDVACREYGLCMRAGEWYLSGDGGADTRVQERVASGCRVFEGMREQRVYDRGGYRGLGVVPDAVVIAKGRVAKFDVDPDLSPEFGDEELFNQVIRSLRCR